MLNLFLWVNSFDYNLCEIDKNIKDCISDLQEVQEIILMNGESLVRSDKIWEQEILPGFMLGNWLFDGNPQYRDEKDMLLSTLNTCVSDLDDKYDDILSILDSGKSVHKTSLVGLYNVPNSFELPPIRCSSDLFETYRLFLRKSTDIDELMGDLSQCFPNLYFSEQVPSSLKIFRPLRNHINEVVRHLEALNEHGMLLRKHLGQMGENEIMQRLGVLGNIECSLQGDPRYARKYLGFTFINDSGDDTEIICAPHTKLYHIGSEWRIYFCWSFPTVTSGMKILVGHIGVHL